MCGTAKFSASPVFSAEHGAFYLRSDAKSHHGRFGCAGTLWASRAPIVSPAHCEARESGLDELAGVDLGIVVEP